MVTTLLSCLALLGDISSIVVPIRYQYVANEYSLATGAIEDALETRCPGLTLHIDKHNFDCKYMIKNNPISRICYAETNVGITIVSFDLLGSAVITFQRWD